MQRCLVIALLIACDSRPAEDRKQLARLLVQKYAHEAYPQWASTHVSKLCPDKLDDLNEYMNVKKAVDPWGSELVMFCGEAVPPGAKGFAVLSLGPDKTQGTDDDVKSWQ